MFILAVWSNRVNALSRQRINERLILTHYFSHSLIVCGVIFMADSVSVFLGPVRSCCFRLVNMLAILVSHLWNFKQDFFSSGCGACIVKTCGSYFALVVGFSVFIYTVQASFSVFHMIKPS
jgi:hypothetical protein